jgi:hypothetical protein
MLVAGRTGKDWETGQRQGLAIGCSGGTMDAGAVHQAQRADKGGLDASCPL